MTLPKLVDKLPRWIKRSARAYTRELALRRETRRRGGHHTRAAHRRLRRQAIKYQKTLLINDLYHSWSLNEIRQPTAHERERLEWVGDKLPWAELLRIKKRCWE